MVGIAFGAGFTHATPQHFLGCDWLAPLEGLVGVFIKSFLASGYNHAGKLMSQDAGKTRQSWIENIAILRRLRHMNIRATYATGFHLNQNFIISRGGNSIFTNFEAWIAPDLTAQISLATFYIFCSQFETWFGIPISNQGDTFHFSVHQLLLC